MVTRVFRTHSRSESSGASVVRSSAITSTTNLSTPADATFNSHRRHFLGTLKLRQLMIFRFSTEPRWRKCERVCFLEEIAECAVCTFQKYSGWCESPGQAGCCRSKVTTQCSSTVGTSVRLLFFIWKRFVLKEANLRPTSDRRAELQSVARNKEDAPGRVKCNTGRVVARGRFDFVSETKCEMERKATSAARFISTSCTGRQRTTWIGTSGDGSTERPLSKPRRIPIHFAVYFFGVMYHFMYSEWKRILASQGGARSSSENSRLPLRDSSHM